MADDFFAQEAQETRAALRNCVKQGWEAIERDTDIRPLIKERPWVSLASAAAGGLVAGYLVAPPQRTTEERRKRREAKAQKSKKSGSQKGFGSQVIGALSPALRTFAASAAGAMFHGASAKDDHHNDGVRHHRVQI